MKYLIFGGSGFLGRSLINYLINKGEKVISVSRRNNEFCTSIPVDITSEIEFDKLKGVKPDVVINCASKLPEKGKNSKDVHFVDELFKTNVIGGLNIANYVAANSIPKLINCSTLAVHDRPWSVPLTEDLTNLPSGTHAAYGLSKLSQEKIMTNAVKDSKSNILHLRLSALYGESMLQEGILFFLLKKIKRKENITLTDGNKTSFDFIHVNDVSNIIYQLSRICYKDDIVNVASGTSVSLNMLAESLKKTLNSTVCIHNTRTTREESFSVIDIQKLTNYIGYETIRNFKPLDEGLYELLKNGEL